MREQTRRLRQSRETRRVLVARLVAVLMLAAAFVGLQSIQGCDDTETPPRKLAQEKTVTPPKPVAVASQPDAQSLVDAAEVEPVVEEPQLEQSPGDESSLAEDSPQTAWEWYLRGTELRRAGETDSALVCLQKTIELAPNFVKGWINLSRVYLDRGQAAGALEAAQRAVEVDSTAADALVVLARAYYNLGQVDDAVRAYENAISVDPNNPFAHNNLGLILIEREAFSEALPHLEKAVELRDDLPYFFNNLGIARERLGDTAGAADAYSRAVEIDSAYEKARINLQRIQRSTGEPSERTSPVSLDDDSC